ncbi:MAG: hypothetical protein J0L70_07545 [Leptolyngbya sp. UWPOB_LEPTO1]|uniref:hypothetical protein n=1 Tax=Leptolyngbya sp. UWPOB_LEPTO1 TaxID=2815653 RepID=UPI001AC52154|nr:hypothetical protein [Leptolyngbya sp. UWPOB_LEPTO1]MBN8560357.1 hypothetical protein [Leptolyngbya sp. UWPOB_LEPTO1]
MLETSESTLSDQADEASDKPDTLPVRSKCSDASVVLPSSKSNQSNISTESSFLAYYDSYVGSSRYDSYAWAGRSAMQQREYPNHLAKVGFLGLGLLGSLCVGYCLYNGAGQNILLIAHREIVKQPQKPYDDRLSIPDIFLPDQTLSEPNLTLQKPDLAESALSCNPSAVYSPSVLRDVHSSSTLSDRTALPLQDSGSLCVLPQQDLSSSRAEAESIKQESVSRSSHLLSALGASQQGATSQIVPQPKSLPLPLLNSNSHGPANPDLDFQQDAPSDLSFSEYSQRTFKSHLNSQIPSTLDDKTTFPQSALPILTPSSLPSNADAHVLQAPTMPLKEREKSNFNLSPQPTEINQDKHNVEQLQSST